MLPSYRDSVPHQEDGIVLVDEVVQQRRHRIPITKEKIESFAIEKYRTNGKGITIEDLRTKFAVKKREAQRSFKHFHSTCVLFTAQDLRRQGINLLQNKNPQQYYASCSKAEILENLDKRKSVHVNPTGASLLNYALSSSYRLGHPLSNALQHQKAKSFLDVILLLPFYPPHIHRMLLQLSINKEYYRDLISRKGARNMSRKHEEVIGRSHVFYTLSPNGTVEVAVRSSDTPFRITTDDDVSEVFSFLGQVRDRLVLLVSDPRERGVLPIMEWILKACDLNKDIRIDDKLQLTLPDIQMKYASRVFRAYVKIMEGKAYYRIEESPQLNLILPEAFDNIRHPFKSAEDKIDVLIRRIENIENRFAHQSILTWKQSIS